MAARRFAAGDRVSFLVEVREGAFALTDGSVVYAEAEHLFVRETNGAFHYLLASEVEEF